MDAPVGEELERALAEDLGPGDLTAALIPAAARARARVVCRETAVLCGGPWFEGVFTRLAPEAEVRWQWGEGAAVPAGAVLCEVSGPARGILSGERTALNFLQTLSAVASVTRRYVEAVAGTRARILDTRKTLPGLRRPLKYAVRTGGGHNHRMGLYDGILIKENHIRTAGSVAAALARARELAPPGVPVEIEVEDLEMLRAALSAGAARILLDNFDLETLRAAVRETAGRARLEASGGITLENVRAVAETGVDDISVGALTKHVRAVDLSMQVVEVTE